MARSLKLTLQYEGTAYIGWQRQAHGTSIQGLVEEAVGRLEGRAVTVIGAGRTDAGVHAVGQVASAAVELSLETPAILRALNATLPPDVRVVAVEEAPEGFHARYHARAKQYRYRVLNGEVATPFERRYAWHVRHPLDVDAMIVAARALVGRHDFAAFRAAGGAVRSTVRTIMDAHVSREGVPWPGPGAAWAVPEVVGQTIRLDISADGFLRHMARAIVGTLVEIGLGRLDAPAIARILASRDRDAAGPTAPAQGLFLMQVEYDRGLHVIGSGSAVHEP